MPAPRILIVDDNRNLAEGLETMVDLHMDDVTVDLAFTAQAALEKAAAAVPSLVILDVNLPDMPGRAVFDALRERYPQTPVILLTGEGTPPDWPGAADRLTKPVAPVALRTVLGRYL